MPIAEAAHAAGITVDQLDRTVRTGLLAVWNGPGGGLVCGGCVRRLLINNKLQ
jgi:hypothetical protein